MPNIEWKKPSDWDDSQDETGINHSNDPYTSSSPGKLKQGYTKQWPPLTHGLVGWWPLSGHYKDLSGNGNHGTPNGGPTTGVAGRGGLQATSFDGTDDHVTTTSDSALRNAPVTYATWLYVGDSSRDMRTMSSITNTNNEGIEFAYRGDQNDGMRFLVGYDGGFHTTVEGSNAAEGWHHYAGTLDGSGNTELYKNGSLVATGSLPAAYTPGTATFLIGESSAGFSNPWLGRHADARIYSRVLSASEIQTLYEWGSADLARPPNDGVSRYALDGDATDAWGSNDGTTNGGLSWSDDAIRRQAANFDGNDDYISASALSDFSPQNLSISCWLKPDTSSNTEILIDKRAGGNGWVLYDTGDNSNYRWSVEDSSGTRFDIDISKIKRNHWNHVTCLYNSSTGEMEAYVNGEKTGSVDTDSNEPASNTEPVRIGWDSSNSYYVGLIDDVRIYDYALTPQEVFELYRYGTRGINMNKHTVMQ